MKSLLNRSPLSILTAATMILMLSACKQYNSVSDINEWLNDPDNGCYKTKTISHYKVAVKYLPPTYFVLKQLRSLQEKSDDSDVQTTADSLLKAQQKLLTFILTVGLVDSTGNSASTDYNDIMLEGISNKAAFEARVVNMNFLMDQHIDLYIDDKQSSPLFSHVENVYELSNNRNFLVGFPNTGSEDTDNEYIFLFDDPFFNLGQLQFIFDAKSLHDADNLNVQLSVNKT